MTIYQSSTFPQSGNFLKVFACLIVATSTLRASGGSATWIGTGSTDWNLTAGTDWSPTAINGPGAAGTVAGNLDIATFTSAGAGTVTDSAANRSLGGIVFNGTGSFTIGSSSNALYFDDYNGTLANVSTAATTPSETIASNLFATASSGGSVGNDLRITSATGYAGMLTLSGNISSTAASGTSGIRIITSGVQSSTTNSNNVIALSGIISDGAHATVAVSRARDGVLILSGANTFSGGFVEGTTGSADTTATVTEIGVNSVGSVGAIVSSAFGTGTLTVGDGGEISSNGLTAYSIDNNINFSYFSGANNSITFGNATNSGQLTFAGAVNLNSGSLTTATATISTASNVVMSGVVSGSGTSGLTKTGSAMLTLSGANTYTGTTTIGAGNLRVNNLTGSGTGTGAVLVNSGGALGGTGTIGTSGIATFGAKAVEIASGGTLAPSNGSTTGFSHLNLSLASGTTATLDSGCKLAFNLGANTATSDEVLDTGGQLALNSQQFSDFSFTPQSGFTTGNYVLIDSAAGIQGALNGTLANLTGAIGAYNGTLSVSGNDLILTVAAVPEPGSCALMLGGLAALVFFRLRLNNSK